MVVPALGTVLGLFAGRPGILQRLRGGGVVVGAIEAADEALAVDALDPEVLQVVQVHAMLTYRRALPRWRPQARTRPVARIPADGRDPQQGSCGEVAGAVLDVQTALAAGGLSAESTGPGGALT
jgi:hypothetical protein